MSRALIGLGANLGDRRQTLDEAVMRLGGLPTTTVVSRSTWYETVPVGGPLGQEPFLNGCAIIETALEPETLLTELLAIETALGRVREVPWGPRAIDLDLLLYDDVVLRSERLQVPHPRLAFRKFVLRGANEIAATWRHPVLGRTLGELVAHLETTPRYVALIGKPHGFRTQFAAEAADAARAKLVDATDAGILPSVELFHLHGQSTASAIEFLTARTSAVRRSLVEAGGVWVLDDAWPAAEATEMWQQLDGDERYRAEAVRLLTTDVMPRLIVSLDDAVLMSLPRHVPDLVTLPPIVAVNIADREQSLIEIAAALEAAT